MILFELTRSEANPTYRDLEISNVSRQYDFLRSIVKAAVDANKPFLSQTVIRALNFQAIVCLHVNAGEYRPCPVTVGWDFQPPEHYQVQALMDDFVNVVNHNWSSSDAIVLASYVLWRLNYIHPFINGNGRTARAAAYFVLCAKAGGWLPGEHILPELLVMRRTDYVIALKDADRSWASGSLDLSKLHTLLQELIEVQLAPVTPEAGE